MESTVEKRTYASDTEFVTAYATSSNLKETAEKLGVKVGTVQTRASKLRKSGVNLPKFARKVTAIHVDALNQLLAELAK